MLCEKCYGRGWRMGDTSGFCPTCHGSGVIYCCEGENVNMAAKQQRPSRIVVASGKLKPLRPKGGKRRK